MSHALGEVWSLGGELLAWFEYNGTCDVAQSRLHPSKESVLENWRGGDPFRTCTCGRAAMVILFTSYGNGFFWPAKACTRCHAITEGLHSSGSKDGHPFPNGKVDDAVREELERWWQTFRLRDYDDL